MDLRGDVQQFLTGMRARLTPEQAGVPMFGGERRVPGLRREEVAQLAGVSTAYYTRLERGNLRGVSESVLRSLARILRMTEAETQHLFDLARAASDGTRTQRVKPQSRLPLRAAQLIDAMPDVPAVALGRLRTWSEPTPSDERCSPTCSPRTANPSTTPAICSSTTAPATSTSIGNTTPAGSCRRCVSSPATTP